MLSGNAGALDYKSTTYTIFIVYRELGVRWQAAGVMSAAALKVALSFSGNLFTELTSAFGKFHPGRWNCVMRLREIARLTYSSCFNRAFDDARHRKCPTRA